MTNRWRFKSVRTRQIVWLLVVAMAPVLLSVAIFYEQRATEMKARELARLTMIRDLTVRELDNWLDERTSNLEVASQAPSLRGLERALALEPSQWTQGERQAILAARRLLRQYVESYDAYSETFVMRARDGDVIVSTDPTQEGRHKEDLSLAEVLRTRQLKVRDIYYSHTERRPAMTILAPLFCLTHSGDHLFAVVIARIDLERSLYPLLQDYSGFGSTGETLIVNRDAIALNALRWHGNAPLKLKITAKPAARAAAGETGIAETPDYRGEPVLAAYTHIPRTGWGFVAKRDLAEVEAPLRLMASQVAIILAISVLLVAVVAVWLSQIIAGPIMAVAETAKRIGGGDLTARCVVKGEDEVAGLASSLNHMADTVAAQVSSEVAGTDIANIIAAAATVDELATTLIDRLMEATGSNIGAFYLRNASGRAFDQLYSVGLSAAAPSSFDARSREGEFGGALATRAICYTTNISPDTAFAFKAVVGTAMPREVVTAPLHAGDRILAVVSMATLGGYSAPQREVLDRARTVMATALANLLATERTARMAEALRSANEELQTTNEELQSQSEALYRQTEELDAQRQQVQQADRLKSEFLSNMSHELRTPLNSVLALSQLMIERGLGKDLEQEQQYLHVIERNGRHLLGLINDVLDLSKIEAGRQEVSVADLDPGEVAAVSLATVNPLADKRGLRVALQLADDLPVIHSDRDKVRQILLNLLSNAVKFTDAGRVDLRVTRTAAGVAFAVSDTGIGISRGDLARIFEAFLQVDGSTTRRHGGTGLGLPISQHLARLLGGEITASSEPGRGSTFTLTLPLRCPEGASGEANPIVRPPPLVNGISQEPGGDILVVEDDEIAVIQIRGALEAQGYRVMVATGGAEGLAAVRAAIPDAMVLDLMMPEIDGFEVLDQIRSIPETERLPVLVLTAKELTKEERARLRHNHVHELVQKGSVDRAALVERVADLVRLGRGQQPGPSAIDASGAAEAASDPGAGAPLGEATVLVVEDNPDNLLTITALLDELGVAYVTAGDGEQALRAAAQVRPNLILMDIQLPGVSGLDATRQLKADPELRHIPVIALTARAMTGDREEILAAGCDGYVGKPIDPIKLFDEIRRWIGGRA